jgi:hypothetical protein
MTQQHDPHTRTTEPSRQPKHGGHGWMMIACCVPMLVIAIVLVASGTVSAGWLFAAVTCTVMMAAMMRGMHNG